MIKIGTLTAATIAANLLQQTDGLAWLQGELVAQLDTGLELSAPDVLELSGLISEIFTEGLHVGLRGDLVEMYPDAMPSAQQV